MSNESELPPLEPKPPPTAVSSPSEYATVPPTGGPSIPPLPITVSPSTPSGVSGTEGSRPPMAGPVSSPSRASGGRSRGLLSGLFFKLFSLSTKLVPIAGVLVGGYYSYTYFFGKVPAVESAAVYFGASPTSATSTPSEGGSKAGQMLQQTRDVVAANNSKVGFANALAGDLTEGFPPAAEPEPQTVAAALISAPVQAEPTVEAPPPPPKVAILDQFASFEAERAKLEAVKSEAATSVGEVPVEKVVSLVPPSSRFLQWASELRISGVRTGTTPKVMVNGLTLGVGGTIDHRLGITFEGLAENDRVIVFKDKTDALVTVEY